MNVLGIACALLVIIAFIYQSEVRTNKAMSVEYCFDSNGDYYVVPNEACNN